MRYRAVKLSADTWALQWRLLYVIRGMECDFRAPPRLGPRGPIWPTRYFGSQQEAEIYAYELIAQERERKRHKKQKGSWLPEYY